MRPIDLLSSRIGRIGLAALGATVALGGGGLVLWNSGLPQTVYADARLTASAAMTDYSSMAGVRLRQVSVAGRSRTPAVDVLDAIDLPQGAPLIGFDPTSARERLESLPTVKTATVERRLPDQLYISLVERTPIAIWQNGDDNLLIDAEGVVLGDINAESLSLPLVSGKGAPEAASDLLTMFSTEPALAARVKAAIRVGNRRWDLWVDGYAGSGVQIKLPETAMETAFRRLSVLDRSQSLLERDLAMIDMRVPDRLVIRTAGSQSEEGSAKDSSRGKTQAKTPAKTVPLPTGGGRNA